MRSMCLLAVWLWSVVVVGVVGNPVKPPNTIVVVAIREGCHTFVDLLRKFDLQPTLEFEGPFTVFIPTDEAFTTFESSEGGFSTHDPERLKNILLAHITEGLTPLSSIEDERKITPLLGCYPLEFSSDQGFRSVNGSKIIFSDIEADNGLVNVIDKVVVPVSELSCLLDPVAAPQEASPTPVEGNIIQVFEKEGFSTFLDLIQELGIDLTTKEGGHFTIFAPTNEAFNAIDATRLSDLRADPETFGSILLLHIVEEESPSEGPKHGLVLTPLKEGHQLTITNDENGAFVNGVAFGDGVKATNGVIHPLSQVLFLPEESNVPKIIILNTNIPGLEVHGNIYEKLIENGCLTFAHLIADANLTSILEQRDPYTVFAPTDEAFQFVESGALDNIKSNPPLLENLLLAHIAKGVVASTEFKEGLNVKPLLGTYSIDFALDEHGVMTVNGAQLVISDIQASNGVVHVVNKVFASPYQADTSSSQSSLENHPHNESESPPEEDKTQPQDSANTEVGSDISESQFHGDFGQVSQLVYVTDPKIEKIIDGEVESIPEDQDPTSDHVSPEQHQLEDTILAKEKINDALASTPVPSPNEEIIAENEEHATVEEVPLAQDLENRESRKQEGASIPNLVPDEKKIEYLEVLEPQQDQQDKAETPNEKGSGVEASEDIFIEEQKPEEITVE